MTEGRCSVKKVMVNSLLRVALSVTKGHAGRLFGL